MMKIKDLVKEDVKKLKEAPVGPPPPIHTVPDYRIEPPQQFPQPVQQPVSSGPPPIHTVPDYRIPPQMQQVLQQQPTQTQTQPVPQTTQQTTQFSQQAPQRPYVWQIKDPVSQLMTTTPGSHGDPRVMQQKAQIAQQLASATPQGGQAWSVQFDPVTGQTTIPNLPTRQDVERWSAIEKARKAQAGPQEFGQVGDVGITFPAAYGVLPWASQQPQGAGMTPQQMQQHLGLGDPVSQPSQGAQPTLGPDDETGVYNMGPKIQVAHKTPTMRELAKRCVAKKRRRNA